MSYPMIYHGLPIRMATGGGSNYDPTNVAITGGTINNTSIGQTTPAAGKFTTLISQILSFSDLTKGGLIVNNTAAASVLVPVKGNLIIDGTDLKYYDGAGWVILSSGGGTSAVTLIDKNATEETVTTGTNVIGAEVSVPVSVLNDIGDTVDFYSYIVVSIAEDETIKLNPQIIYDAVTYNTNSSRVCHTLGSVTVGYYGIINVKIVLTEKEDASIVLNVTPDIVMWGDLNNTGAADFVLGLRNIEIPYTPGDAFDMQVDVTVSNTSDVTFKNSQTTATT